MAKHDADALMRVAIADHTANHWHKSKHMEVPGEYPAISMINNSYRGIK
jgi:hypothetical protein